MDLEWLFQCLRKLQITSRKISAEYAAAASNMAALVTMVTALNLTPGHLKYDISLADSSDNDHVTTLFRLIFEGC